MKVPRNYTKPLPLLEIVWSDSQLSTGGWESHSATMRGRKRVYQRSIGYILADDKQGVMLAGSLSQGSNVHGVVTIPASQIVKRRKIR
jgi:hypothetical protein